MPAYFFSDVHLGLGNNREERQKEDRLLGFLRTILPTTETLFIVGDLFDFWFDYQTVVPRGFHRTLCMLQEFTDRNIPVHYVAGNHDYWIGGFFRDDLKMILHLEPFEITMHGKRIYIHHGDGLARNDFGYRMIKPVLRNPLAIKLYRLLHPDLAVRIARGSSRTSRAYTSDKDYGEEDGMIQCATQKIQGGVDIVVMGHRHQPRLQPIGSGVYVNLGDWITCHSYGVLQDGSITLQTWDVHEYHGEK
jgi:UDP-2,3-diacylglucosamine hydrolase